MLRQEAEAEAGTQKRSLPTLWSGIVKLDCEASFLPQPWVRISVVKNRNLGLSKVVLHLCDEGLEPGRNSHKPTLWVSKPRAPPEFSRKIIMLSIIYQMAISTVFSGIHGVGQ